MLSPPHARVRAGRLSVLTTAMAVTAAVSSVVTGGSASQAAPPAPPAISPPPQSVTTTGSGFKLPAQVGIVAGATADQAAVNAVEQTLQGMGIGSVIRRDGSVPNTLVTIYIGNAAETPATADALTQLRVAGPEGLPAEGYVLASGVGKDHKRRIVLAGADDTGTFYAAQTLRQVITRAPGQPHVPALTVRDWPGFAMRGGMESFYGPTWSWDDRYDQVDFLAAHKMNYFFYGPADDLRTGTQWDENYPADELAKFAALVRYAADRHVTFIYRISPEAPLDESQGICHSSEADRDKLIARFQQLYDIGVRRFVIAWDDVNGQFACGADQDAYGGDQQPLAAAQAAVLNDVQARFFDQHPDVEPVITVPTEYYDTKVTPYRTRFDELVTPKMQVYWTGHYEGVTRADAEATQKAFPRHRLVVWTNYPVNDYAHDRLFLGPLVNRDPGIANVTLGITFNEMNQQAPSQVPLWTEADFAWNPAGYDPWRSWAAALEGIGGQVAESLRVFAENNQSNPRFPSLAQESPTLAPLVRDLMSAYIAGKSVAKPAHRLDRYLVLMRQAPDRLRQGLRSPLFLAEATAFLDELEHTADAGAAATAALSAQAAAHGAELWRERLSLDAARQALASDPAVVAPGVPDALYDLARAESDAWFGVPWYADLATPAGGPPPADGSALAAVADHKLDTAYHAARGPLEQESLELPLTQTHSLRDVVVLRASDDVSTGTVQAHSNGQWVDLGRLHGPYTVVSGDDLPADAVRVRWDAGASAPTVYEILPRYADVFTGRLAAPNRKAMARGQTNKLSVDLSGIAPRTLTGTLQIDVPDGWQANPTSQPVKLHSNGRTVRQTYSIDITVPSDAAATHTVTVTVTAPNMHPLSAQIPVYVGSAADVPYAAMVAEDSPNGYWRLGEQDGTVVRDSSGHGQDGTYQASVALGVPGAVAGDSDTAAHLDGGYGEIPSSAYVSPTGAYTVEAWVRPSAIRPAPGTAIVEKYSRPAYNGFALRLEGSGRLQAWNLGASSYARVTGTTPVSTGVWHHVAAVFDGEDLTVYLDGLPDGSVRTSLAPTAGPESLKIGARGDDAGQRWQGDIDEVALYPRALTADEVMTHYVTGAE